MGDVATELTTAQRKPGPACTACHWLEQNQDLDEEDRKQINEWIDSGKPIQPLWHVLKKRGLPTSIDSFRRYHCRERHHERAQ